MFNHRTDWLTVLSMMDKGSEEYNPLWPQAHQPASTIGRRISESNNLWLWLGWFGIAIATEALWIFAPEHSWKPPSRKEAPQLGKLTFNASKYWQPLVQRIRKNLVGVDHDLACQVTCFFVTPKGQWIGGIGDRTGSSACHFLQASHLRFEVWCSSVWVPPQAVQGTGSDWWFGKVKDFLGEIVSFYLERLEMTWDRDLWHPTI